MSIFSEFFRDPLKQARQTERVVQQSERKVQAQLKPLGDVGLVIVQGAHNCTQQMKPKFKVPEGANETSPENYPEIWVFYEFLYFFMHMTMRHASAKLREDQIQRLQDFLGPLISSTAVDTFCRHWPEDLKKKMRSDFYSKLNDAEMEYSKCKGLLSKDSALTGDTLFSTLGRHVAELSGDHMNPETIVCAINSAVDAYKAMSLDSLLGQAANVL